MFEDEDWEISDDFLSDFIPKKEDSVSRAPVQIQGNGYGMQARNSGLEIEKSFCINKILKLCDEEENFKKSCIQASTVTAGGDQLSDNLRHLDIPKINSSVESSANVTSELGPTKHSQIRINLINTILSQSNKKSTSTDENRSLHNRKESEKRFSRKQLIDSILRRSTKQSRDGASVNSDCIEPEKAGNCSSDFGNSSINDLPKTKRNVSFLGEPDRKYEEGNKVQKLDGERQKFFTDILDSDPEYERGAEEILFTESEQNVSSCQDHSLLLDKSESRIDSKSHKSSKQVIVRKFPGPAGILPDDPEISKISVAYLKSFVERENDPAANDSRISEFCSQNTKNLFTSGAWQAMIDDLPVDFLRNFDIARIKYDAKKGSYKKKNVPFMAGIIHQIDTNWIENPMILLKDSTDQIEASFHMDIFNIYPNTIEVGSVILLKEVIIIFSRLYIYALVHPNDIVAIYNESGRILTTESMEQILEEEEKSAECRQAVQICQEDAVSLEMDINSSLIEAGVAVETGKRNQGDETVPGKSKRTCVPNDMNQNLSRSESIVVSPEALDVNHQKNLPATIIAHNSPMTASNRNTIRDQSSPKESNDGTSISLMDIEVTPSQSSINFISSTLIKSQFDGNGIEDDSWGDLEKNCGRREQHGKERRIEGEDEESRFADLLAADDEFEEELSQMDIDSFQAE